MYADGKGVAQDYVEAVKWYKLAAEQGVANAKNNLALMYENGQGVVQDYAEAVKWYKLAAEQGDTRAQFNLALMYGKGQGVVQDYISAHMWFNLAAAQGYKDAVNGRDKVAKIMTQQQITQAQKLARECLARKYKGC